MAGQLRALQIFNEARVNMARRLSHSPTHTSAYRRTKNRGTTQMRGEDLLTGDLGGDSFTASRAHGDYEA